MLELNSEKYLQFIKEREIMKKVIFIIMFMAILIAGICFWKYKENEKIDAEAVRLKQDLKVPFGVNVKVSDFIENLNGTLLEDDQIDTEKLGDVRVSFDFTNVKNKRKTANFTIKVIDINSPQILSGSSYTVNVGYRKNLTDVLLSGDDADDNPTREILGEYDLNMVGDYNLTYVVTDSSGNQAKKDFVLHVKEKSKEEKEKSKTVEMPEILQNYKTEDTKIGIDVSKWQEEINWQEVKNAGIEFAMIRIGYQTEYDGDCVLDPCFVANIEGAKAVNLPVGIYFYSYAKNVEQAISQAQWVKENLQDYEIDLPVAFDWESWNSFNQAGMSFYKINKMANCFLETLENAGYKGMLYSSKFYLEKIWYPSEYEIWLAQYNTRVTYEGEYSIWQMSESGRVNGIENQVDIDVMYLRENEKGS